MKVLDLKNKNENLLFKFSPININLIKLLINSEIWFSAFNKLNDPFEGQFEIEKLKLPSDEILFEFYSKSRTFNLPKEKSIKRLEVIKKFPDKFYGDLKSDLYKSFFNRLKVACFCQTFDEVLMWSHYANEHKGICLIFDKELLINQDIEKSSFDIDLLDYDKVSYKKRDFLKINFQNKEIFEVFIENLEQIIFFKLGSWKYEKEFRIVVRERSFMGSDGINFGFDKRALKGIIFGEKCSLNDIRLVGSILKNYKYLDDNFFWGASKIVPSTGKLKTIKDFGDISIEDFMYKRNEWLYHTHNQKQFIK